MSSDPERIANTARGCRRVPSLTQELLALLLPAATLAAFAVARDTGVRRAFAGPVTAASSARARRVCADANALPFSNRAGRGFANKSARVVSAERGHPVEYTWWAQRRGFVRNTLAASACDLVIRVSPSSRP